MAAVASDLLDVAAVGGDGESDGDDDPLTSVSQLLALATEVADEQAKKASQPIRKTSLAVLSEDGDETATGALDHCQVCDLPTESKRQPNEGSLLVCQACKKFFQRNRNRQESSLRCITGTNKCDIGKSSAETIATGVVWRKVCPRCRLSKCLAIGMQNTYRDIWPALAQLPLRNPEYHECSAAESALKQTTAATAGLANSFLKIPLKVNEKDWANDQECWHDMMDHFEYLTRNVSSYVKSMPGYNDLPVKDRCALFGNSLLPITLAEANRINPTPGCFSPGNAEKMFMFFPEYRYVRKEAHHLWGLLQSWNPSLTEFSCLLAVLFYKSFYISRGTESSLHGSNGNIGGIADLELAIRALLMQQCGGDVSAFNSRIQHLLHVAENLRSTVIRRQAASAEVAARCPHLFQMNALYTAVQREYYKNNAPSPPTPAETSNPASTISTSSGVSSAGASSTDGGTSSTQSAMNPPKHMPSTSFSRTSSDYGGPRGGNTPPGGYPTPPGGTSSSESITFVSTPTTDSITPTSSPVTSRAQFPLTPSTVSSSSTHASRRPSSGQQQ